MWQLLISKLNQNSKNKGFTLIELVVVISIILVLATLVVPVFQTTMRNAKEVTLKDTLFKLRDSVDKYTLDKEEAPQSLDDLVKAQYIREIPTDPITGQKDWQVEIEDQPVSRSGKKGIKNVFSNAEGISSNGVAYKDF
ncbi:MAG: type II secretion system protein [Acidobacteria bacterium]|nr:type II secretion system protein [Acidobacteriota bacterium]